MNTVSDLAKLLIEHPPVSPRASVYEVAELINQRRYKEALSIPVVDRGIPVGVVSRYHLFDLFINPYGRDLHGRKPIHLFMNPQPLIVTHDQSLEEAAQYISANMAFPLTEDFIITRKGRYQGIGYVLNLLKAMEQRVAQNSHELGRAYRQLKNSQAQLIQSEKMASLGQMVAGVAHEINTPLGYVKNNVQMTYELFQQMHQLLVSHQRFKATLESGEADESALDELMRSIYDMSDGLTQEEDFTAIYELFDDTLFGVDQISELVLNLKNFSRMDRARTSEINLNECIDSALLIGRNNIKHKAEVIRDYQDLPQFEGAASQINQVFLNLINNAAQAIDHEKGRIRIRTFFDESAIYASIEDNGSGIEEAKLKRIFDPFFTTKPVGQGTGLGLSICYRIIQAHGGRIRVASKPGIGTRFLIAFPRRLALQKAS